MRGDPTAAGRSAVPFFEALVKAAGIERGPNESLAEGHIEGARDQHQRARAEFQRRAAGRNSYRYSQITRATGEGVGACVSKSD